MFKKYHRKPKNPIFVIFRLLLSLTIFVILVGGALAAYKQFSGVDIVSSNPKAVFLSLIKEVNLNSFLKLLPNQSKQIIPASVNQTQETKATEPVKTSSKPLFKFALVADSHNENDYLKKALQQVKPDFFIGLGDYTEVGTIKELQDVKKEFDATGIRYFVTAGDHDLWESRNKQLPPYTNFRQVFGQPYQSFNFEKVRFLVLYNSDNYQGLSLEQWQWLQDELARIKTEDTKLTLAFLHEPLYHPSSAHTMGWVSANLKEQAEKLTKVLKDGGVKEVFSGDIHYFGRYTEPKNGLAMTTMGAVASQRNAQLSRFAVVTIYDDYSYNVEDVEIK